jgi:hypothetical protein
MNIPSHLSCHAASRLHFHRPWREQPAKGDDAEVEAAATANGAHPSARGEWSSTSAGRTGYSWRQLFKRLLPKSVEPKLTGQHPITER